jgi:hypothetical protein
MVLALGGSAEADGTYYFGGVYAWTGTMWSAITTTGTPAPDRADARVGYDPVADAIVVAGGDGTPEDLWHLAPDNSWTEVTAFDLPFSFVPQYLTVTATPDGLVAYDPTGTWRYAASQWIRFATGATPPYLYDLAYDPGRACIVGIGSQTWVLTDSWQAPSSSLGYPNAITYDPSRQEIVAVTINGTYGYDGTAWASIAPTVSTGTEDGAIAFERSTSSLIYLGSTSSGELQGTSWQNVLSPGAKYSIAGAQRRGSVFLVSSTPNAKLYERSGTTWSENDGLPVVTDGFAGRAFTDPRDDALVYVTRVNGAIVALSRHYRGPGPDESCVPGQDTDGDGLSGCDDLDCWSQCSPACPFATSCP